MSRYTVVKELGRGGMGVVYKAHDAVLQRTVALKVLQHLDADDDHAVRRFKREVRICQQLRHPHVIRIFDAGELEGNAFFTMELVEAETLEALIENAGPLPPARAASLAAQLCDALAYVHENGLLHRDLKPANVMVRPGDDVVLMDFGLAKICDATLLTAEGNAIGTPRYMGPELVRGGAADARSDVWAAGVVLYEMLAGSRPFTGNTLQALIGSILDAPPPPLRGVPADLEGIVRAMLEKDPARRVQSAREAAQQLASWRDDDASAAYIATIAAEPSTDVPIQPTPPPSFAPTPALRAGAVALAFAALGLGALALRRPAPPPPPPLANPGAPSAAPVAPDLAPGSTLVTVSFDAEHLRAYRVEVVPAAGGAPVAELLSSPGNQVRRVQLEGLAPATAYLLRIRTQDGDLLGEQRFTTRSRREAALRLIAKINELKPYKVEREFTDRYFDLGLDAKRDPALRPRAEALGKQWQHRVQDTLRRLDLPAAVADFAATKDALYSGSELSGAEKRLLYARVDELAMLEDALKRGGAAQAPLAERLESPAYGLLAKPGGTTRRALAIVNEGSRGPFTREAGAGPDTLFAPPAENERLRATADIRDERQRKSLFGRVSQEEDVYVVAPNALASRLPGNLELRACLEGDAEGGLRVYSAEGPEGVEPAWRLLAVFRPRVTERHVVAHAIPADVLGPGPVRLKLELGYSTLAYLDLRVPRQEIRVKWMLLGWPTQ